MPFTKGTVPDRLKGKGIPQKYVNQFIEVFNSVLDKTGDEGAAYRQAYGVMNKALHKDGYVQGTDGKWHKGGKKKKESFDNKMPLIEEFVVAPLVRLSSIVLEEKTLDAALADGLTFEGVALIDHAVSQLGTGYERYYSPEFNDLCMSRTNAFMDAGHIATVYNSHGSALGGFFTMSTEDPIGKLTEHLKRVEDEIHYKAHISPTDAGKNVIMLLYDGVREETSVRIYEHVSESCELLDKDGKGTGEFIYNMTDGYIGGIDFCDEAGIPGAGVKRILESSPAMTKVKEKEEEDMEWDELTLEELREKRPDLLNAYAVGLLEAANAQVATAKQESDAVKAEMEALKANPPKDETAIAANVAAIAELNTTIQAVNVMVEGLTAQVALERAAQFGIAKIVAEGLRQANPKSEELEAIAKRLWDEALARATAEIGVITPVKGKTSFKTSDVGDEDYAEELSDEQLEDIGKIFRYAH